jgi:hypothetical protein
MNKTENGRRHHAWFALADAEHCRLLCCRLTWLSVLAFFEEIGITVFAGLVGR